MAPDFRQVLRTDTRRDHDHLDQLISTLDITRLSGFRLFVQLHLSCFLAMQTRVSKTCMSSETLDEMVAGLRADLDDLSGDLVPAEGLLPSDLDPLAIDYMVAGSRLGSKILRKRWAASDNSTVRRVNSYFGQVSSPELWRETCVALSELPVDSTRATVIVRDTRLLFQLFVTVFDTMVTDQDAFV